MDETTRALRADIVETRAELGDAVQELATQLTPRRQAQRVVSERREAARQRLRALSSEDPSARLAQARDAVQQRPAAAAGLAAAALLLLRRRRRRRR